MTGRGEYGSVAILACGALAREITTLIKANDLTHVTLKCLPASLHNTPDEIPGEVDKALTDLRRKYDEVLVAYGDCGTGGGLDRVLEAHGVERINGPHCYSFLTGNEAFAAAGDDDMRSFFLTDFLARQFDAMVVRPLGLDRYPGLVSAYFGNYEKLVFLAQTDDPALDEKAKTAAKTLGLNYIKRKTGYGDLETFVRQGSWEKTVEAA